MNLDHVTSGCFVLGRDVHCKFDYWPLAVSMPPTKDGDDNSKTGQVLTHLDLHKAKDKLHKAYERASEIRGELCIGRRMASMRES